MKLHRIIALAAVAAAVAVAPLAAQAADVEVVVTASRIEEPAEQAAASVTVITAADLEASGQVTLVDALERVAGVSFRSTTGSPSNAEVSMGGFGENSHGRVLVLVDGRRVNRPDMAGPNWLQVPVENVERVEVLRGPATVLYGDHAVGGVINIITKKGADELAVTASAMGGSWLLNQERLGVSGAAGPVRFALSGERSASDGYRDRSAWSSLGGGLNLDAELSESVEASLRLGYNQTDYQLPGALSKAQWDDDPTLAGNPSDEAESRGLSVDAGLRARPREALEVRLNASYSWNGIESDIPSLASYTDVGIHSFSVTPRLSFSTDLAGVGFTAAGGSDLAWESLGFERFGEAARVSQAADAEANKRSAGLYVTTVLDFGERLSFEVGGRYELALIEAEGSLGSPLDDSKLHHGAAGTASLLYRFAEGARAWARVDRVYRYPFLDEQVSYYNYGADEFLGDLDAERGYAAELGAALSAAEGLRLCARASLLDMNDEIAFNGATFRNENLDKTRHLGVSGEAGWKTGPLSLAATYTWQLTTFREGANEDSEVPLVPNHEAFAEARLRLPAGFEIGGSARYVSESYQGGDTANTQDKVEDYFLVGASASWKPDFLPGALELFAGVENLLDADYAPLVYYNAWSLLSGYYPAPGRSWRVGGFYRYH